MPGGSLHERRFCVSQEEETAASHGDEYSGEWDCGEGVGGLEPKVGLGRWMR